MDDVLEQYRSDLKAAGISNPSHHSHKLKLKLQTHYGDRITFRRQNNKNKPLLLFPTITSVEAAEALATATESIATESSLGSYDLGAQQHQFNFVKSLHYMASKLQADLLVTPGHPGYGNINRQSSEACVPDSLYTLFKWIMVPEDQDDDKQIDDRIHKDILQICQTIVYIASGRRKNTPKQIGTGLLIHHATRSKKIINYLNATGDSISHNTVNCILTSTAESQIAKFVSNENTFIPDSLSPDKFVLFAAHNLDIMAETLDSRGTFRVTQMVECQPGPSCENRTEGTTIGSSKSLKNIPADLHKLFTVPKATEQVLD